MKLDKIRFARLMNVLSRWGLHELGEADIREIDDIIDVDMPPAPMMNAETLHVLMSLMQEGTKKIEAIKQHRMMTGYGLKESKDIVEKYWHSSEIKLSKNEFYKKLNDAGIDHETDNKIASFINSCF